MKGGNSQERGGIIGGLKNLRDFNHTKYRVFKWQSYFMRVPYLMLAINLYYLPTMA